MPALTNVMLRFKDINVIDITPTAILIMMPVVDSIESSFSIQILKEWINFAKLTKTTVKLSYGEV